MNRHAKQFYEERDSRTRACAPTGAFRSAALGLSISEAEAATPDGQAAFLLSANLLARWARVVTVSAPSVGVLPAVACMAGKVGELGPAAVDIMRRADPFGSFEMGTVGGLGIHIGTSLPASTYGGIARGWLAGTGTAVATIDGMSDEPGVGALFLACMACAAVFRHALGETPLANGRVSLWSAGGEQGPPIGRLHFGRVLLPGFGAVGSAWGYLLPIFKVKLLVEVVDGDTVAISNLNRSPLFFFDDVGKTKAGVASGFFGANGVPNRCIAKWLHEAVRDADLEERHDLVVPAANEFGARLVVQQLVPPLQVYGTTGRDWQAFSGRHIPLRDDCLLCRFPDKDKDAGVVPPMACSTSAIPIATGDAAHSEDAALPFLSTAAAVMAFAESARLALGRVDDANFACFDFRADYATIFTDRQVAAAECVCHGQRRVWRALNGKSRFASLSG